MKLLVIDADRVLLDLCLRASDAGHDVIWWIPQTASGKPSPIGDGFGIRKVRSWEPHAKWADLIVTGDNAKYTRNTAPLFTRGFPIFGCNPKAAQLELDRGLGQRICEDYGIPTLPYVIVDSYDDAIKHVEKTMGRFVSKPWGGDADKALSYVAGSPEDMIFKLEHWKKKGRLDGQMMLQERVDGIEMAVGGWFSRAGWSDYLCENFEEKKFMNDNLGQNTGEMGTTLRYVQRSKLFDDTLAPVTDYLHKIDYVGYVDMNTIIEKSGRAWPLEFTMRFGYPLNYIQEALHLGDPIEWMLDAVNGRNTLRVSEDVAVGIVFTHGMYPNAKEGDCTSHGIPMYGIRPSMERHLHMVEMQWGEAPLTVGGKIKQVGMPMTAGCYALCVTGTGEKVSDAQEAAYEVAWKLKPPTNKMFRTDLGCRLKEQLPILQSKGYAERLKY